MKHIILCADDYGQNDAISQAIIDLFNKNRLSATSCMTNSPLWPSHAKSLAPFMAMFDIGLHFNLTEGKPLSPLWDSFNPLSKLILKSYLGGLNRIIIEDELNCQLDAFAEQVGQLPHFIDGHQHVHQLPVIRQALLNVYAKRLTNTGTYIRSVFEPLGMGQFNDSYIKRCIIQLCGAYTFRNSLKKHKIQHNSSFAGFYNFHPDSDYPSLFRKFLMEIKPEGIIMCHPGLPSKGQDPIEVARYNEYQYFAGSQFLADCQQACINLK